MATSYPTAKQTAALALFPKLKGKLHEEEERLESMSFYEKKCRAEGYSLVAGLDEAGRGPLAGPVIAAAVILPPGLKIYGLTDSKKLSAKQRESIYQQLHDSGAIISWAAVGPEEIDRINIYHAALKAMFLAAQKLVPRAEYFLIDGTGKIDLPGEFIIKGDSKSVSIAAASIIAKVTRDRIMDEFDRIYPAYGFAKHKGYPTQEHYQALQRFGPCEIHRRSFRLSEEGGS